MADPKRWEGLGTPATCTRHLHSPPPLATPSRHPLSPPSLATPSRHPFSPDPSRRYGPAGAPYADEGRVALTALGMQDMMPIGSSYSTWDALMRLILLLINVAVLVLSTLALLWSDRGCWIWIQGRLAALQAALRRFAVARRQDMHARQLARLGIRADRSAAILHDGVDTPDRSAATGSGVELTAPSMAARARPFHLNKTWLWRTATRWLPAKLHISSAPAQPAPPARAWLDVSAATAPSPPPSPSPLRTPSPSPSNVDGEGDSGHAGSGLAAPAASVAPKWKPLEIGRQLPDFETMADRRDRVARNHVRLLLRGQRWQAEQLEAAVLEWEGSRFKILKVLRGKPSNPRAPYEADFFFPQVSRWQWVVRMVGGSPVVGGEDGRRITGGGW